MTKLLGFVMASALLLLAGWQDREAIDDFGTLGFQVSPTFGGST